MNYKNAYPDKPVTTKAAILILILSLFFALNGLAATGERNANVIQLSPTMDQ